MHNVLMRANTIFFMSITTLAILCAFTTFSTYFHEMKPVVKSLQLNKIHSLKNYRDKTDRAIISFDLNADLSSIFNWNVKQVFVFVVAEYTTPSNTLNHLVIWDHIIQNFKGKKNLGILKLKNEAIKYFLADQYDELRNVNVTLRLKWDIMPVCGGLYFQQSNKTSSFKLPSTYMGRY